MDNNNLCDMMNRAQGIVKACNIANTVDSTISELNWAINSNRIEDKTNELKRCLHNAEVAFAKRKTYMIWRDGLIEITILSKKMPQCMIGI